MKDEANHKSRTARACDLLRDTIVQAEFAPGEKLRIDQLGQTLGVSTGAVREALSRLTAEGLVIAEPQKGFVVAPISRTDLEDLTKVRIEVEGRCLADSITHGDVDWEGNVLSIQHRLRSQRDALTDLSSESAKRWHALHEEFHDQLTSACQNRWWLQLRRQLYTQSERYRRLSGPVDVSSRNIDAEHDAIADAALARRTDEAVGHMTEHLQRTTSILLTSSIPFTDERD